MSAAAYSAPGKTTKSGNSKLFLWMGVLVLLLAVTGGLAYVAFRQFVRSSSETAVVSEEMVAIEQAPFSDDPVEAPFAEEPITPEAETVPEEPAPAALEPVAPEPVAAPAPSPKPAAKPQPRAALQPSPAPRVEAPAPKPAVEPIAPAPAPAAAVPPLKAEPAKTEPPEPPPAPKGSKVLLSGSEAYSPPPAPTPASLPGATSPAPRPVLTAGDVFWSGVLKKGQTVTVDFSSGNGGVGGQALPGKPVRLESFSPVVEITELPGPENGWKRFSFKAARDAKKTVTINFHWALAQ